MHFINHAHSVTLKASSMTEADGLDGDAGSHRILY